MKIALMFPGQASQEVGMGRSFYDGSHASREIFERADDVLGFSITELCFSGPEERLKQTEITQPAILTVSAAAWAYVKPALEFDGHGLVAAAGHSLGEYSALVAAGAMEFEDAVRLVHARGKLMQEAVPEGEGAMSAVLGVDADIVESVCGEVSATGDIAALANLNSPGQLVISGSVSGVEKAEALLKEKGAKKLIRLPVSAPFHCPLMRRATEGMIPLLQSIRFRHPEFPVLANLTADVYPGDPVTFGDILAGQIEGAVKWISIYENFRERFGAETALELGPGKVLCGLAKRIDLQLPANYIDTIERSAEVIAMLSSDARAAG